MKVVSAVEDILQISRDRTLQQPGRAQRSLASHRQILDMVRAGDAAAAKDAMEYHLTAVEPELISGGPRPVDNGIADLARP